MKHPKKIKPDVNQLSNLYNILFTRNNPKNFNIYRGKNRYLNNPNFKNENLTPDKLKYCTISTQSRIENKSILTPPSNLKNSDINFHMPKNYTNCDIYEDNQNSIYVPEKFNQNIYKTITTSNMNKNNITIPDSNIKYELGRNKKEKNDLRNKLFNNPSSNSNNDINNTVSNILPKKLDAENNSNRPIDSSYLNSGIFYNNIYNKTFNTDININNININDNNQTNFINVEDLTSLEEKLKNILENLQNIELGNNCIEFFMLYFNSSLLEKFPTFFRENNKKIVQTTVNLILVVIGLYYNISLNDSLLKDLSLIMKQMYNLIMMNYYLFVRKLQIFYGEEFCDKKEIYFHNANLYLTNNNLLDLNEHQIISIINHNNSAIFNIINKKILPNFRNAFDFFYIVDNISELKEQEIYDYFFKNNNINNNNNPNNNESIFIDYLNKKISPPYIKTPTKKKYTLVLDIINTLVNIKHENFKGKKIGICKLRPGLIHFLNTIKPYYEIISFTTSNKKYSETLIKQIEMGRKIFDYNLYRDHTVLYGNEFIKDISRIGRDIKKIIIVDDEEKNFRLNKNNGICINPYLGENDKDDVLFELAKLLIFFYRHGYSDLRNAVKNFKKEIDEKVTKNFN